MHEDMPKRTKMSILRKRQDMLLSIFSEGLTNSTNGISLIVGQDKWNQIQVASDLILIIDVFI
jgi:hypothetical protein